MAASYKLTFQRLKHYYQQIAQALLEMHLQLTAHNDVKLENILVFNEVKAKLADFGYSTLQTDIRDVAQQRSNWSIRNGHFAPELCSVIFDENSEDVVDELKCDIFALGFTMFKGIFGFDPFDIKEASHESKSYESFLKQREQFWSQERVLEVF